MKPLRAKDILTRLIDARPDEESYAEFSSRIGLSKSLSVESLNKRRDVTSGLMYRIAKAFGYQILFYNPNPPQGLEKIYVVGTRNAPIKPRERKNKVSVIKDSYTGEKYRIIAKRKRKSKTFRRIEAKQ